MAVRSTLADYAIREEVGSGSYGSVFKAVRRLDGKTYALKEVNLSGMTPEEKDECYKEAHVLVQLDSPHIIKYYDAWVERGRLYLVTEYAGGGTLHDLIRRQAGTLLPEAVVWKVAIQTALGLHHMHSRHVLHRDVKTLNVFLDAAGNVKLGDLGVAKVLSSRSACARTLVGTPYYLAPELLEDRPYREKCDVWALGVCVYEACAQAHPFEADNQGALMMRILRGRYPSLPSAYSRDMRDLVRACLTLDASVRADTVRLLQMRALREQAAALGIPLPAEVLPTPPLAKQVQVTLQVPVAATGGKPPPRKAPSSKRLPATAKAATAGPAAALPRGAPEPSGAAAVVAPAVVGEAPAVVGMAAGLSPRNGSFSRGSTGRLPSSAGVDSSVTSATLAAADLTGPSDSSGGLPDVEGPEATQATTRSDACGGAADGAAPATPPPSTDRGTSGGAGARSDAQQLRRACVDKVGEDVFGRLYELMRPLAEPGTGGSGAPGDGNGGGGGADGGSSDGTPGEEEALQQSLLRLVPQRHLSVVPMVAQLLVAEAASAAGADNATAASGGGATLDGDARGIGG